MSSQVALIYECVTRTITHFSLPGVHLTGKPNLGRVNKTSFWAKGFFFSFNVAIHSGAIKQNVGDTFISKFAQLRLTQWGFTGQGHSNPGVLNKDC